MKFKRIIAAVLTLAVAATALPQITTERRTMFAEGGAAEEETTEETSEADEGWAEEGTSEEIIEAEEEPDDNPEYTLTGWGETWTLFKYNGAGGDVVIPEEIDGKRITEIGGYAFSECTSLTSVVIPDGVTVIGSAAFSGCTSLKSVAIPSSVIRIENAAFRRCTSLASIVIPDGVQKIGNTDSWLEQQGTFSDCVSLTSIEIPDSVTFIGGFTFAGCTSLTSVVIPAGVTNIDGGAFQNCNSLAEINVDENNTSYSSENGIVFNKDRTVLVQYPEGRNDISYSIPDTVTEIYAYAFYNCASLTSIDIPAGVTSIGDFAFYNCTSLTSIVIPDGVTTIGDYAFTGCTLLTSIVIPDSVINIDYGVFKGCASLTKITIPDGVTNIGNYTFEHCTSLTSIVIPNSVTSIGEMAFDGCTSLISIAIPDSVTSIGHQAFYGCTSLTSVEIPDSVSDIGVGVFSDCNSLTEINVGENNTSYSSENGILFDKDKTVLIKYPASKADKSYSIPNTVTEIKGVAFYGCSLLTSVIIPNSVTKIGNSVFANCGSLTEINVDENNTSYLSENGILFNKDGTVLVQYPAGKADKSYSIPYIVTKINESAFDGCASLTSVEIPDGVTDIRMYTFKNCTSLRSIKIPDGVTNIEWFAFENCSSLSSIVIPNNVTSIGGLVFSGCTSLISAVISNEVTNLDSWGIFQNCTSLTSILIPDSVTKINKEAFDKCPLLTIYGTAGSYAQTYADEHLINFVALGSEGLFSIETGVIVTASDLNNVTLTVTKGEETSIENSFVYGIDLNDGSGSEFQPTKDVTVKIPVPSEWGGGECKVYRKEVDGKYTDMNAEYENGYMVFTADKSGEYIITAEGIITDPIISDTENDTGVNIVLPDKDAVPDDTILNVDKKPSEEYKDAFVFDITLTLNGQPIQPNAEVTVRIPIPAGEDGFLFMVYYRAKDGKLTDMKATVSGLYLMFKTDHFSEYIVTKEKLIPDYILGDINSDGKINTADARWVLQCASGKRDLTDAQRAAADVNGDGKINTADAKWLLQVASGKRQLG